MAVKGKDVDDPFSSPALVLRLWIFTEISKVSGSALPKCLALLDFGPSAWQHGRGKG